MLDAKYGDRSTWVAAFMPLILGSGATATTAASASQPAAAAAKGVGSWGTRLLSPKSILAASLCLLGIVAIVGLTLNTGSPPRGVGDLDDTAGVRASGSGRLEETITPKRVAGELAEETPPPPATASKANLVVKVVEAGRPVPKGRVILSAGPRLEGSDHILENYLSFCERVEPWAEKTFVEGTCSSSKRFPSIAGPSPSKPMDTSLPSRTPSS